MKGSQCRRIVMHAKRQQTEHGPSKNALRLECNRSFKERLGRFELVLHHTHDTIQHQPATQYRLISDTSLAREIL